MRGGGARRPRLHDVPAGMLMLRRPKVVRTGSDPRRSNPGRW